MKRNITLFGAAAFALVVALIAAGCGSSAGGSLSGGLYGSGASASAPTHHSGPARVSAANTSLGRIVVDNTGRTLYLFEKDTNGRSACYGPCATYWPPLLTNGKPLAQTGVNQQLVGTTRRQDGSEQVTYAGHPLYLFLLDRKPGQTNGEGSQDFGAGWNVLSQAGNKIESDAG
jgi:predicted lipoprotein with Yx(FWY)xxD motif